MKPKEYGVSLPVGRVHLSPFHFRKETAKERLDDLARSIDEVGLIHAISVVEESGLYSLINGHRRLLAHKQAGKKEIPRERVRVRGGRARRDEAKKQQASVQFLLAANSSEPLIPHRAREVLRGCDEQVRLDALPDPQACITSRRTRSWTTCSSSTSAARSPHGAAHPESFSEMHLRVLADTRCRVRRRHGARARSHRQVAEALARQKKLVESPRARAAHITEIVKNAAPTRRPPRKRAGRRRLRRPGEGALPLADGAQKGVDALTTADLAPIKEIDLRDKGKAYQDALGMAQQPTEFAEGPLQALKATILRVTPQRLDDRATARAPPSRNLQGGLKSREHAGSTRPAEKPGPCVSCAWCSIVNVSALAADRDRRPCSRGGSWREGPAAPCPVAPAAVTSRPARRP